MQVDCREHLVQFLSGRYCCTYCGGRIRCSFRALPGGRFEFSWSCSKRGCPLYAVENCAEPRPKSEDRLRFERVDLGSRWATLASHVFAVNSEGKVLIVGWLSMQSEFLDLLEDDFVSADFIVDHWWEVLATKLFGGEFLEILLPESFLEEIWSDSDEVTRLGIVRTQAPSAYFIIRHWLDFTEQMKRLVFHIGALSNPPLEVLPILLVDDLEWVRRRAASFVKNGGGIGV